MNKITNLKIEKEFFRIEKNADGDKIKVPYTKIVPYELELVTGWKRMGHYIIDFALFGLFLAVLGIAVLFYDPFFFNWLKESLHGYIGYFIIPIYYFLCEVFFQRTMGKVATNCLVVDEYGKKPTTAAFLIRSFARIIPFEAFSCFADRGWHDHLSKTYVITNDELKKALHLRKNDGSIYLSDSADLLD